MDRLGFKLTPPMLDEAEVTLIGGTGGFGECVVMHLGNNEWAIVDCCIDPISNECLPLLYLQDLEVNIETQVKYIICTHWHQDHIAGLSKLISACSKNTVFVLSCAEDRQKFVYEFASDFDYTGKSNVLNELKDTLDLVAEKGIPIKRVEQDKTIFRCGHSRSVALSPSETEVRKFENEVAQALGRYHKFTQALKEKSENLLETIEDAANLEDVFFNSVEELLEGKEVIDERSNLSIEELSKFKDANKVSTNDRSVAMLVSFGNHHVILGADLEVSEIDNGWHSVLRCESMKGIKANMLKIPHHGSETGYLRDFLIGFIKPNAIAKMTSWVVGAHMLPKAEMVRKYFEHTQNLYITTTKLLKFKNTEPDISIRKIINEKTEEVIELVPQIGIIQSRINIASEEDEWTTKVYGSALQLTQNVIDTIV